MTTRTGCWTTTTCSTSSPRQNPKPQNPVSTNRGQGQPDLLSAAHGPPCLRVMFISEEDDTAVLIGLGWAMARRWHCRTTSRRPCVGPEVMANLRLCRSASQARRGVGARDRPVACEVNPAYGHHGQCHQRQPTQCDEEPSRSRVREQGKRIADRVASEGADDQPPLQPARLRQPWTIGHHRQIRRGLLKASGARS
jgi:hypothetical protein